MGLPLIDNLSIKTNLPIDDGRTVVDNSTVRDSIEYKYDGLKVFQLDTRKTYIWNLSKFIISGVISTSWDIGEIGAGNLIGTGNFNYSPKWDVSPSGITSSSIVSSKLTYADRTQKVGINGLSNEAFQVNANYNSQVFGATSMPFVISKGLSTVIGENWYYDAGLGSDRNFNSSYGSSTITFNKGGFVFKGRTSNSSPVMNNLMSIDTDASVHFNNYISMTGSLEPSYENGSMYFDASTNRWKVMEGGVSRFISKTYNIYTVVLSQLGVGQPTESLLESTIGIGTWTYIGVGIYNLTVVGGFSGATPQISGFCGPNTSTAAFFGVPINANTYQIRTVSSAGGGVYTLNPANGVLNNTLINIKVWKNISTTTTSTTTTTTTSIVPTTTTTTTTTSTTTTTTTAAARIIFWNFSTIGPNYHPTIMSFRILKNGVSQIYMPTPIGDYYHYNLPIEGWDQFNANVGDVITVTTILSYSGSSGNTIGTLDVRSTTGTTGYPYGFTTLDSELLGPASPKTCTYTFTVQPGLNYCLSAIFEQ